MKLKDVLKVMETGEYVYDVDYKNATEDDKCMMIVYAADGTTYQQSFYNQDIESWKQAINSIKKTIDPNSTFPDINIIHWKKYFDTEKEDVIIEKDYSCKFCNGTGQVMLHYVSVDARDKLKRTQLYPPTSRCPDWLSFEQRRRENGLEPVSRQLYLKPDQHHLYDKKDITQHLGYCCCDEGKERYLKAKCKTKWDLVKKLVLTGATQPVTQKIS